MAVELVAEAVERVLLAATNYAGEHTDNLLIPDAALDIDAIVTDYIVAIGVDLDYAVQNVLVTALV